MSVFLLNTSTELICQLLNQSLWPKELSELTIQAGIIFISLRERNNSRSSSIPKAHGLRAGQE
jgi:hypothetical protein